jgi:hypothetical protein
MQQDNFELGGKRFKSRLIVGTGKYKDFAETRAAVEASGAEIVTVAVRRVIATAKTFSITSIPRDSPSCRTRPAATRPKRRFAPVVWRAKQASAIWSSLK